MYNALSRYVQQMQLAITSQNEEDTIINYLINKINVAVSEISYKSIPTAHVASETTVLRHISNQQVNQSVSDNHHQIVIIMTHVIYEFDNYYESSLS